MTASNQPKKITKMVEYQEGSVVSRTLMDKTSGTITLFAFDKDQGLSEHKTPYEAVITVLEGEAEVKIADKPNTVKAGELIVLPANISHALRARTRFKMMLIMIKEN